MIARVLFLTIALLLGGCDLAAMLADPKVAQREADAKAIGGACRFGMRSIEDCYALNDKVSKSAIFTGWKDMDQYMRDNKIEGVAAKISHASGTEEVVSETKSDKVVDDTPPPKAKSRKATSASN